MLHAFHKDQPAGTADDDLTRALRQAATDIGKIGEDAWKEFAPFAQYTQNFLSVLCNLTYWLRLASSITDDEMMGAIKKSYDEMKAGFDQSAMQLTTMVKDRGLEP